MVDSETKIVLSMKQLLSAIAGLVLLGGGVLWTVLTFTVGGIRDDVSAIRASTQTLQVADKDGAVRVRETENRLADQISGLRVSIAELSGKLGIFSVSMNNLSGRVDDLQKQVVSRQSALRDPQATGRFIADLKKAGLSDEKIVFVPFGDSVLSPIFNTNTPSPR